MAEAEQDPPSSPPYSDDDDDIYSDCLVSLDGGTTILPGALRNRHPRSPRARGLRHRSGKRQAPQPPTKPGQTPTSTPTSTPTTTSTPVITPTPTLSSTPSEAPTQPAAPSSTPSEISTQSLSSTQPPTLISTPSEAPTPQATPKDTPTQSSAPISTPTPPVPLSLTVSTPHSATPSPDITPTPSLATTPTPSPTPTRVQMVLCDDEDALHSPVAPIAAPPTPQRTEASVCATRAARNMMIRLIDDDSDSESQVSDSFDEHIIFPARPVYDLKNSSPLPTLPAPSLQPTPSPSQSTPSPSQNSPSHFLSTTSPSQPTPSSQSAPSPSQSTPSPSLNSPLPSQFTPSPYQSPPPLSPMNMTPSRPPPAVTPVPIIPHTTRGRARRLMHSTSDPGMCRPTLLRPRPHSYHSRPQPPTLATPLHEVEEEETDGIVGGRTGGDIGVNRSVGYPGSNMGVRVGGNMGSDVGVNMGGRVVGGRLGVVGENRMGGRLGENMGGRMGVVGENMGGREGLGGGIALSRSDSNVTVATIQEELLVTPGIPLKVTLTNLTIVTLITAFALPHTSFCLYTTFRLVFGTLFPAYYSYKAVKTKNVKEYVKWMMYWIVFAFFTCFETLTDLFLSFWFPFYYELKILVVLWLLSPATRGSSILYRKFVHPWLARREEDIDQCIAQARQQGYSTVVQLGTKGVNYATNVFLQTAIKGGGGLMNQLRRSYSQSELDGTGDMNRNVKALPPHMNGDHYASDYALDQHALPPGSYELERRGRAESDAAYKSRGSSASRGVRSTKTRSADVSEVYYQDATDDGVTRRRSPRTADNARSQPTLHFQEPPPRETQQQQRPKRGRSENRPRPKSMITPAEVQQGAEWARHQRMMGSTTSLNTDNELSSHSSHSSSHSVRPKARTGSQRRPRVDSQGRKVGGSTSRSRTQPIVKRSSIDIGSESD